MTFKSFVTSICLCFSLVFALNVSATHIIGGDIIYECMGFKNGNPATNTMVFRITIDMYRDCQAINAAQFDNPAHVTVFYGNGPYRLDSVITVYYQNNIVNIDPPDYPCLTVPSNVCVHRARYQFDVELEIQSESYHIVWQRCCRNRTINNIYNPGDYGATYAIEITPTAQLRCNNSPRFNEFPPTVICIDEPMDLDHSASDPEGDNIVYEFCTPLNGGGRQQGPGADPCRVPNPNPDCPPPFETVLFRAPTYTENLPNRGKPQSQY